MKATITDDNGFVMAECVGENTDDIAQVVSDEIKDIVAYGQATELHVLIRYD